MKQVNFSHPGGFPLEQETLERLQTAYRSELYEAIKRHLSILPDTNYLIAHAQSGKKGWAVVHQDGEGILYPIIFPITGGVTNYLKTIRTTTNLIYGDGNSQKAYTDYQAEYVRAKGTPTTNDTETVNYYDLGTFKTVKNIQEIEEIIEEIDGRIKTIEATIPVIDNRVKTIEETLTTTDTRINTIETDLESYLPLDGSKAMKGDLNLGTHQLYLNNTNTSSNGSLLVLDNSNKVVKSNTMIEKLIERIEILELQKSTAVPLGMIAIWGKPAPFPEGWEEYVPLRGRMPVGLDCVQSEFNQLGKYGGEKNKLLTIQEMPSHGHDWLYSYERDDDNTGHSYDEFTFKPGNIPQTDSKNPIDKTGGDQPFSLLNPYHVVHFIEYTGRPIDLSAPLEPVFLTESRHGQTYVDLNWYAPPNDGRVTVYMIYKNHELLETVENTVFSYTASGLSRNTSYMFHIVAKDKDENLSLESNRVIVRTNGIF